MVIKEVDRERWVTISEVAVPLQVGTAMAAEVAGVCMVAGILDLILCKCLCAQRVNCVYKIFNK